MISAHLLHRLSSASPKPFLLVLAILGTYTNATAQTQTFDSATPPPSELAFTASAPGSYFTPNGAAGIGAYGVNAGTTTINFAERTIPAGTAAGSSILFEVANPVGAFNTTSSIQVLTNIDRAGYTPQVTINADGSSSAYDFGASFPNGSNKVVLNYTGTNNTITVGRSNQRPVTSVTINGLPAAPAAAGKRISVRVILTAAASSTLLIDDMSLITGAGAPLPVELTRFDAVTKGLGVNLAWATASEKNSAYFEVQRSAMGEAYEAIGKVAAQGNTTSPREYDFTDAKPLAGQAYYRLRQVDADGTAAYSPVAIVRRAAEFAIYPNPSTDAVTLPAGLGPVRYRVLNGLGQALASGLAAGGDRLDLSALPKGAFFLELSDTAGRRTQRLMRQ